MISPTAMTRNWMKHSLAWLDAEDNVILDYKPVRLVFNPDGTPKYPAVRRVY